MDKKNDEFVKMSSSGSERTVSTLRLDVTGFSYRFWLRDAATHSTVAQKVSEW
jgi:hypothetical protein